MAGYYRAIAEEQIQIERNEFAGWFAAQLQSGKDPSKEAERLEQLFREILHRADVLDELKNKIGVLES